MISSLIQTSKQQNEQVSKSSVASGEYEDIKILQEEDTTAEGGGSSWLTLDKQPQSSVEAQLPTTDDEWGPLPFSPPKEASTTASTNRVESAFGFVRHNYIDSIRTWSSGGSYGFHPTVDKATASNKATSTPSLPIAVATSLPVVVATPLPMDDDDCQPPGMVLDEDTESEDTTSDGDDETMSDAGSSLASDDDGTSASDVLSDVDDDDHVSTPAVPQLIKRGVSFNEQVRVLPIPPITAYTHEQRYKMYANRFELRENKTRNKKEYEFDNYDWRNATEENSMAVCPLSGELLHPAHLPGAL
jgi:hypothetical protein